MGGLGHRWSSSSSSSSLHPEECVEGDSHPSGFILGSFLLLQCWRAHRRYSSCWATCKMVCLCPLSVSISVEGSALVVVLASGIGGLSLASASRVLWTHSKHSTSIEISLGHWAARSVVGKTSEDPSSLSRSSILTGQSWIGSIYSVVPKMSFLEVGDLKVLMLGIGDEGERQGGVGELRCVEVIEDSEKMNMAVV